MRQLTRLAPVAASAGADGSGRPVAARILLISQPARRRLFLNHMPLRTWHVLDPDAVVWQLAGGQRRQRVDRIRPDPARL